MADVAEEGLSPSPERSLTRNCSSKADCNELEPVTLWDDNCTYESNWTTCDHLFGDELGVLVVENPEDFRYPWISNQHFYANILTYLVTMLFGLVGNIAFIAVMAGDRKVRTTTNVFLVSLTVADLLMLSVCAPLEIVRLFVVLLNFGGAACRMGHYFMMLSFTASVLNLTAVSLERFIVIVYPMKARSLCTLSNCRRSVLFVWAVSLLLACPSIWVMGEESIVYTNPERTTRVVAHYCRDIDSLVFPTYRLLVLFCIPGLLMTAFYTAVIRELWLSTKNISMLTNNSRSISDQSCLVKSDSYHMNASASHTSFDRLSLDDQRTRHNVQPPRLDVSPLRCGARSESSVYNIQLNSPRVAREHHCHQGHSAVRSVVRFQVAACAAKKTTREKGDDVKRTRKQVIKMLIVIVVLFVLCWGPNIIVDMLIGLGKQIFTQEFYVFKWVSSLLPFVHCCINPVIYCFMSKNFRSSMSKALSYPSRCCRGRCRKRERGSANDFFNGSLHSQRHISFSVDLPTAQTEIDVSKI